MSPAVTAAPGTPLQPPPVLTANTHPVAAPVAVTPSPTANYGGYGGFWIRVVAFIIDAILVRVVVAPVGMIFGGLGMAGALTGIPHRGLALLGGGVTLSWWFLDRGSTKLSWKALRIRPRWAK